MSTGVGSKGSKAGSAIYCCVILHFHFSLSCIGDGNGNPLQYSYLENPRDGEPCGLPSMGHTGSNTTEVT